MIRKTVLQRVIAMLLLLGMGLPVNATILHVATWESSSEILTVDSNTGVATSVGFAGTQLSGLTSAGSILNGWGQNGSLYTVNQTTGGATLVGASGSLGTEGAIAFNSSDGFLYASDSSANNLVMIDSTTGAGTVVGSFNSPDISGLTFIGSSLYGVDASADTLVTINIATGAASSIGSLGFNLGSGGPSVGGLVYTGSQLLAVDSTGIYSVNIGTGAASFVSGFSSNLSGRPIGGVAFASSVPEPTTLLLLGLGLAGLGFARKRLH